jgi:uncharacterized membrane protein
VVFLSEATERRANVRENGGFLKDTLFKGLLFLIPIVVLLLILSKAVAFISKLARPLVAHAGAHSVLGIGFSDLVAVAVLLVITLGAGLIAQTRIGTELNQTLERIILRKMPGYTLLKSMGTGTTGIDAHPNVSVALASISGMWMLAFVMEEHANGLRTIFVPRAPTPAAGNLYFMNEDQIRRMNVPVATAMKSLMRLGVGSRELFETEARPIQPS